MDEVTMLKGESEFRNEDLLIAGDCGDLGIVCDAEPGDHKIISSKQQQLPPSNNRYSFYRIASPPPVHQLSATSTHPIIDMQCISEANIVVMLLKNGSLSMCHADSGIAVMSCCYIIRSHYIYIYICN